MPTIKRTVTLAANGSANPLTGSQYEFLPFDALVEAAIIADSAAAGAVEANMFSGSDLLLENAPVDEKALTEVIRYPDDYQVVDVAAAGERIGLTLRETAAGAQTVRVVIRITPA
jgi:phosphopantothenoylcysteine synthetase/decarboxylase